MPLASLHPLRRQILDEVHARPFQLVRAPRRFLHTAFTTSAEAAVTARAALEAWCDANTALRPDAETSFHCIEFPSARLRWERHTEFTTYGWDTLNGPGPAFAWPLSEPSPVGEALPEPGPLLVAVDLALVPHADAPTDLTQIFDATSLCLASVHAGAALIATDFRQDSRGFTRILVIDKALTPALAGALVQRLLEIETYRTFALLGLPEAYRAAPVVSRIEQDLGVIMSRMRATAGLEDNARMLDDLMGLGAELEAETATSAYRFGATRAYAAIVQGRLDVIGEEPFEGSSTWRAFLDRRMQPAIRTCQTVADRQADLARKLTRATNLLRTRVDIEMESQNRAVLEAMNKRAQLQLRLQHTVEGLSVAAISYYVLGLIGALLKGAKEADLIHIDPSVATAVAVPFVVGAIWWTVRRIRRHHLE